MQGRPVSGSDDIGRDILHNGRFPSDKCIVSDPHKLMYRHQASDRSIITDSNMPGQRGGISEHDLPSGLAVVSDMGIGHEVIFFSDFGHPAAESGPPMDGYEFPDDAFTPDFDVGFLPLKFDRLRDGADGGKLKNRAIRTDGHIRINDHMTFNPASRTDDHVFPDNGIRSDIDIRTDLRTWINNRSWMNHLFSPILARSSASATSCPSTEAVPAILMTFERT